MARPSNRNITPINAAPAPPAAAGGPGAVVVTELYAADEKIYPRAVSGWFAAWRWALVWATQLVFYGTPWLTWNDRQAVLFDIVHRKFFIFGLVWCPRDVICSTSWRTGAGDRRSSSPAVAGRLW